jgi:hypothetical protein
MPRMKAETGAFTLTGGDAVLTVIRLADLAPALKQREKPVAIQNEWLRRSLLALE